MTIDKRFDNEINPIDLIKTLYKQKKIIIFITFFFSISSIAYSLLVSEKWVSTAILEIAGKPSSSGSTSSIGGSSAISAFVGMSGSSKSDSPRAAILLRSKDLVKRIIKNEDVLENIFAFKAYDPDLQRSIFNTEIYNSDTNEWKVPKPSYIESSRAYNRIVSIEIDKFNGFITVSVTHGSPIFANKFLELIIKELNDLAKERELSETERSLDYLYLKLEDTFQENVRLSISSLIENQLKKQMFANVSDNFLLNPLDGPYIPDLRSSPQRTRIVVIGTGFGFFFGLIFVLFRIFFRSLKDS